MEQLYNETTDLLLKKLKEFKNDNEKYKECKKLFDKEDLLYQYENWETIKKNLKEEIFAKLKKLNDHLLGVEKNLLIYESLNINKEIDVNIEDLSISSNMLSRNKEPLDGFYNSPWYLPCYPNLNMIEFLHENDEE